MNRSSVTLISTLLLLRKHKLIYRQEGNKLIRVYECIVSDFHLCNKYLCFIIVFIDSALASGGVAFGGAGGGGGGRVPMPAPGKAPSSALQSVDRVRNVFPETWLWTNKSTGYQLQLGIYLNTCFI